MNLESRHHFIIPSLNEGESNAVLLKFIRHHCCEKLKFRRKSEAIKRAMSVMDTDVFPKTNACSVYHCKFCGGWHFSSRVSRGYAEGDILSRVKGLRGKQRRRKVHNMRQKNKAIAILRNLGFLEDIDAIIYRPIAISKNLKV